MTQILTLFMNHTPARAPTQTFCTHIPQTGNDWHVVGGQGGAVASVAGAVSRHWVAAVTSLLFELEGS